MKYLLLLSFITLGGALVKVPKDFVTHQTLKKPTVYICEGSLAYAYHKKNNCKGLQYCTKTITAISKKEAKESYKRQPCKMCHR